MKAVSLLLLAGLTGLGFLGCESIAGIEDRTLDPDAGGDAGEPPSEQCQEYCDEVLANCTGEFAVYTTEVTCLGTCALLDPGEAIEPSGNTVACRLDQAKKAASTEEPNVHCPSAGPGGNGVCGDNCESYCSLYEQSCPDEFENMVDCEAHCQGLLDLPTLEVERDHDGDTLQCRLVHVSSATVQPDPHCAHAWLIPSLPWCVGSTDDPPVCEDYCRTVGAACQGDDAVYESEEQCLAACAVFEPGESGERVENTFGCRQSHAYSSLLAPAAHCAHASPAGDGHCGLDDADGESTGNCDSYCMLLEAACPDELDATYGSVADCQSDCAASPESFQAAQDQGYSVATAEDLGDALQCRILHAVRTLGGDEACAAAVGGSPCN
jgi:hypothetical protein